MNFKLFFQRKLSFWKSLVRLHHSNAILFFVLILSGFILFSTSFRSTFPSARVIIREVHIWIGFILCIPILFYIPKLSKHLSTLRNRRNNRINLFSILLILTLLIGSGVLLTYQRQFTSQVSMGALFIHDFSTWLGVPYVIYHSLTRSKWFKKLGSQTGQKEALKGPIVIEEGNPMQVMLVCFLGQFMDQVKLGLFI